MPSMVDAIRYTVQNPRHHVFFLGSPKLGVSRFVRSKMERLAPGSVRVIDADGLKADEARELMASLHEVPELAIEAWQVLVLNAHKLSRAVLPQFLSIMEEGQWARFVFQAASEPRWLGPVISRCKRFRLSFMSRKQVLANMQALHFDALKADTEDLYDGTLEGTVQRLAISDALVEIKKQVGSFDKLPDLVQACDGYDPELLFQLSEGEREFILRAPQGIRRRLVVFLHGARAAS